MNKNTFIDRSIQRVIRTMKSTTSNDNKKNTSDINDFKLERRLEHKTECSKILCVFKRNEMLHFVRSKTITIPDGTCGGYHEKFRYEYELEIYNVKENRLNYCKTISTCSKVQYAVKITDYTKKDYLACILTDKKWGITFWNLDDYQKDFKLSSRFYNDRALIDLKKYESNGRD